MSSASAEPLTIAPTSSQQKTANDKRDAAVTVLVIIIVIVIIIAAIWYIVYLNKNNKPITTSFKIFLLIVFILIVGGLIIGWIYLLKRKEPKRGRSGNGCSKESDCDDGFYCSGTNVCVSGTGVVAKGTCSTTSQCEVDLICTKGICESQGQKLADNNEECMTTADCVTGSICVKNICQDGSLAGDPIASFENATITTFNRNSTKFYLDIDTENNRSIWTRQVPSSSFSWNAISGEFQYNGQSLFTMANGQLAVGPGAVYQFLESNQGEIFITDSYKNVLQMTVNGSVVNPSRALFINNVDYPETGFEVANLVFVQVNPL